MLVGQLAPLLVILVPLVGCQSLRPAQQIRFSGHGQDDDDSHRGFLSQERAGMFGISPALASTIGHTLANESLSAWNAWIDHFSAPQVDTDTSLTKSFAALHPNHTLTVTRTNEFDLFAYAAEPSHGVIIRRRPNSEQLSHQVFVRSKRRRDGDGAVLTDVRLGAFDVAWQGQQFIVYLAVWPDGFSIVRQWFLFHETSIDGANGPDSAADALIMSVGSFMAQLREEILVFTTPGIWQKSHDLWESVHKSKWEDVILNKTMETDLRRDVAGFFKKEKVYKDLGVPWKRGIIFLGPPGNGKTVSLKALMNEVKVPSLYVKTFTRFGSDEGGIQEIFRQARASAPCLLILEDLDSLITDRNRSFFLNEVDGLGDNDGLLIIGTTNHFDRLDGAVSNRPSRFDRKYNFPLPNQAERKQYAVYWQNKLHSKPSVDFPDSLLDQIAETTKGFSFAYLKEAFVSTLLLLAGDEESSAFGTVLESQIKALRQELNNGSQDEVAKTSVPTFVEAVTTF